MRQHRQRHAAGDGLKSELYNVVIVADPAKLVDGEIGALSDYVAMQALDGH